MNKAAIIAGCIPLLISIGTLLNAPAVQAAEKENIHTEPAWQTIAKQYPALYQTVQSSDTISADELSAWWKLMHDDVLNQLIAMSMQQNRNLMAARSKVNEARAALGISKAALLPWFNASGSWSRTKTSDNSPYTGLRGIHNDYKLGIDASWEIDVFGQEKAKLRTSSADLQAEHARLYSAWVSLSAETAINYFSLLTLQEQLRIAEATVDLQAKNVAMLQSRYAAGLADELALMQAKYTLSQTKAELPVYKTSIAETLNRLAILTGTIPGEIDNMIPPNRKLPEIDTALYIGIPAETLRQRPDIQAAERALAAQQSRTKAAEDDLKPKFSLTGSLGFEAASSGSLLAGGAKGFSLIPQITLPIFNGGAVRRNINVQNEREQQYLAAYENTVLTAAGEVRNALTASSQEINRTATLREGIIAAKAADEIANNKFANGLTDYQPVIDAERNLLSFQQKYVMSRGQQLSDLVQLFKALGGGWSLLEQEETAQHQRRENNEK